MSMEKLLLILSSPLDAFIILIPVLFLLWLAYIVSTMRRLSRLALEKRDEGGEWAGTCRRVVFFPALRNASLMTLLPVIGAEMVVVGDVTRLKARSLEVLGVAVIVSLLIGAYVALFTAGRVYQKGKASNTIS